MLKVKGKSGESDDVEETSGGGKDSIKEVRNKRKLDKENKKEVWGERRKREKDRGERRREEKG